MQCDMCAHTPPHPQHPPRRLLTCRAAPERSSRKLLGSSSAENLLIKLMGSSWKAPAPPGLLGEHPRQPISLAMARASRGKVASSHLPGGSTGTTQEGGAGVLKKVPSLHLKGTQPFWRLGWPSRKDGGLAASPGLARRCLLTLSCLDNVPA